MKYVVLLFTGLVLMGCGISRSNGNLRKVKVDRTTNEVEAKESRMRDWDALLTEHVVISGEVSADNGNDDPDFVSDQSSAKEEGVVENSEDTFETERSGTGMVISKNLQEVTSENVSGSNRKIKRASQRGSATTGRLKVSIILWVIVFCVVLIYLIIFFPSILRILGIALLVLLILFVAFLLFGPMVYE